ncbi:hypothetical protein GQ44DRAFT_731056 [Phaeosphaeriaceae sp. PMI808]|nr:hypothetical protein GQ44DRAFT_731056 [Phaeosphaeriaceae sp. PMI808]
MPLHDWSSYFYKPHGHPSLVNISAQVPDLHCRFTDDLVDTYDWDRNSEAWDILNDNPGYISKECIVLNAILEICKTRRSWSSVINDRKLDSIKFYRRGLARGQLLIIFKDDEIPRLESVSCGNFQISYMSNSRRALMEMYDPMHTLVFGSN